MIGVNEMAIDGEYESTDFCEIDWRRVLYFFLPSGSYRGDVWGGLGGVRVLRRM